MCHGFATEILFGFKKIEKQYKEEMINYFSISKV